MRILVTGLMLAVVALLVGPGATGGAHASASVYVKWMNCAVHPGQLDIVYIDNQGDAAQDLAGWELRSDQDGEVMSLSPAGTLAAGQEIIASAGAHAVNLPNEGVYLWSINEMLRDSGEPSDYVRLLDATGAQVSGMDCNHNALAAPAPVSTAPPEPVTQTSAGSTPRPARSSGAQPATVPAQPGAIPVGGGPPGTPDGARVPLLLLGAALAANGILMTFAGGRKR